MLKFPASISTTRIVVLVVSLCLSGCGGEKTVQIKPVKIGGDGGDAGSASPAPPPSTSPASEPIGSGAKSNSPATANAGIADTLLSGKKKSPRNAPEVELTADGELPNGHARFALLAADAPGGTVFEAGADQEVDRFVVVGGATLLDSSQFAAPEPTGLPEGVGWIRDESRTEYDLPEGFTPIESAGRSVSGLPWRIKGEVDGAVMALVPEGTSIQGVNTATEHAGPEHAVFLDAFYIDLFEVTADLYERYRTAVTDKRKVARPAHAARSPQDPVLSVSWAEAYAYAVWAGKELPTEAQWEKAARGTEGFSHPWGNGPVLWHRPRSPGQIDKVGSFRGDLSVAGVFDLAGNAREWCSDWFSEKYYSQLAPDASSLARNPTGPKSSSGSNQRVVKGGDQHWRLWARSGVPQGEHLDDIGFRCVLKLKPTGSTSRKEKKKGSK